MADFFTSSGLSDTPTSSQQSTVSNWAAPYVTNMLNQAQALANAPMPTYTGQLTAGPSDLQKQAWQGLANLSMPTGYATAQQNLGNISNAAQNVSYNPMDVTSGTFGNQQAQSYMNPYLQQSLNPQLEEARRQADINATKINSQAVGAGAFGGNRASLMQSENLRNLGTQQANIVGQGYNTAFQNAMSQYNADQARQMQAQQANVQQREFGSTLGLQGLQAATQANQALSQSAANQGQSALANLQAQAVGGAQSQALDQAALNAQYNQYLQQLQYPQTMLAMQKNMLSGLPIATTNTYGAMPSGFQNLAGTVAGLGSLGNSLFGNSYTNQAGNTFTNPGLFSGISSLWS